MNAMTTKIVDDRIPKMNMASEMGASIFAMRDAEAEHILSNEAAAMTAAEATIGARKAVIEQDYATLDPKVKKPRTRKALDEFKAAWDAYGASEQRLLALSRSDKNDEAIALLKGPMAIKFKELARAADELNPKPVESVATTDEERREAALQVEMVRLGWGREDAAFRRFFTASFIPDAPPELWESFAELLRRTSSAENAARLLESWAEIDVTDDARCVTAPTLVLHARDELRVPMEQARRLASLIPGARFVPLASRNHLLRADEPAWEAFLAEVHAFLS